MLFLDGRKSQNFQYIKKSSIHPQEYSVKLIVALGNACEPPKMYFFRIFILLAFSRYIVCCRYFEKCTQNSLLLVPIYFKVDPPLNYAVGPESYEQALNMTYILEINCVFQCFSVYYIFLLLPSTCTNILI